MIKKENNRRIFEMITLLMLIIFFVFIFIKFLYF